MGFVFCLDLCRLGLMGYFRCRRGWSIVGRGVFFWVELGWCWFRWWICWVFWGGGGLCIWLRGIWLGGGWFLGRGCGWSLGWKGGGSSWFWGRREGWGWGWGCGLRLGLGGGCRLWWLCLLFWRSLLEVGVLDEKI